MVRGKMRMTAVAVCLAGVLRSDGAATKDRPGDLKAIEGLWSGAWGGGEANGVVFQPAIAELWVEGDHLELHGFRHAGRLAGTVRFDAGAGRMHITPEAEPGARSAPKAIAYAYQLQGDDLALIDGDGFSISLKRWGRIARNPPANARVEFVESSGINDAGDLLVTEFTALRAGRAGAVRYRPLARSLNTKRATVLVVRETGLKKITVDEARRLIRPSTPVAIAYRPDDRPALQQSHELWKETGPPAPDGDAVLQTFSRTLRPGTLVFILSARDNVPLP